MTEAYDCALLGILQNEGKVAPFLDAILSFLYRRTDYFRIMKTEHDKLGFPPGVAKKLLLNIFSKYEMLAQKEAARMGEIKKANEKENTQSRSSLSQSSQKDEAVTQRVESLEDNINQTGTADSKVVQSEQKNVAVADTVDTEMTEETNLPQQEEAVGDKKDNDKGPAGAGNDVEEKEDEEQIRQRRLLQSNPLTYNGAERENYLWSQNISEVDVRVKVPKSIVKGKQVRVTITKKRISVRHEQEDGSWLTVVDDDLVWEINTEESMWTITRGEFVHINLEKREERWWECVFVNEPKINTRKIDCSRPMTDLDDEAQAKIEEMMYNQRQKQQGLPQSHEQKTHDILRKAWDAEGSPFKGQPFDPSKFNIDSNGIVNMNQP